MMILTSVSPGGRKDRQGNGLPNDGPGFILGEACREGAAVRIRLSSQPGVVQGEKRRMLDEGWGSGVGEGLVARDS